MRVLNGNDFNFKYKVGFFILLYNRLIFLGNMKEYYYLWIKFVLKDIFCFFYKCGIDCIRIWSNILYGYIIFFVL